METELLVRKNLSTFCKLLPGHVEKWKSTLNEAMPMVRGVANRTEQLRYVRGANIKYMEDFDEAKKTLEYNIMTGIEEDMCIVREFVEKLNRTNQDLRNKLVVFETSSLDLEWEGDVSALVKGGASVPSLPRLLKSALDFWNFFQTAYRSIATTIKEMDWFDEKSVGRFEEAFSVNLEAHVVTYLLAITQYVDNEQNIV